ncbi:MAG: hypothetical protein CM15mP120_04440 [Pseudomonadota bacterium]|nr:MAG: hypothetical protein CM15mP120_04440 [Pseudomonadota bacterium]
MENGLSLLLGARYDSIDMESRQPVDKLLLASSNNFCTDGSCIDVAADNEVSGTSWTVSLSYDVRVWDHPARHSLRAGDSYCGSGC